jgi:chromosome segregation ATPase
VPSKIKCENLTDHVELVQNGEERVMAQKGEEIEQFQVLEEKIERLIQYVASIQREKEDLKERIRGQEEKIGVLTGEVEKLRENRDKAKQKIASLLEKIEQLGI